MVVGACTQAGILSNLNGVRFLLWGVCMGGVYSVALVGFTHNESVAFDHFFRLAARRPPGYRMQDEVMNAQILIVNADHPQALHLVRYAELPGQVLLLGHSDHGTGWPVQHKPVKGMAVLAALDALVKVHQKGVARQPAAPARLEAAPSSQGVDTGTRAGVHRTGAVEPVRRLSVVDMERGFAPTQPLPVGDLTRLFAPAARSSPCAEKAWPSIRPPAQDAATGAPCTRPPVGHGKGMASEPPLLTLAVDPAVAAVSASSVRPGVVRLTDFGGLDARSVGAVPSSRTQTVSFPVSAPDATKPPEPSGQRGDTLLLAESLVEGRILYQRFQRYGLSIDWLREAGQALQMLKTHPYRLVVIDRLNGGPDVYQVCRSVKQRKLANGQSPVVIMFAPTAGSMDRMKAGLAGCDAYFSRAVGEVDLYNCLAQHRLLSQRAFAKTDIGC